MLTDFKLAGRSIARQPGFAAVVVLTLALAIGANTAIFSFCSGILLRPLPYTDPDRVVLVKDRPRHFGEIVGAAVGILSEDFRELQPQLRSFSEVATLTLDASTLTGREKPDLVFGAIVTHNFFSVLGSRPALGRTFSQLDRGSGGRLAVLSHRLWQDQFGGSAAVIGQALVLNSVSFTIVGVMPADFDFPHRAGFWLTPAADIPEMAAGWPPGTERGNNHAGRGNRLRTVVGRLRPGVSIEAAEQELVALAGRLPNPTELQRSIHLVTVRDQTVGNVRPALLILLGGVATVLLIASFNVANLLLSRAIARQQELAVRLALGSSRWRITRQLLTESLVLATLGGIAGVLLSRAGLGLLVQAAPEQLPRLSSVSVDLPVLGFALGVTLLTGVICGLVPVIGTSDADLATATKSATRGNSGDRTSGRMRTMLVTGEVAVSFVLLIAAGLLAQSFWRLQSASWGFDPTQIVSARIGFTADRYREPEAQRAVYRALLQALRSEPGFTAAAASFDRIGMTWMPLHFTPQGQTYGRAQDAPQASYRLISPDYFRTLGIPLLQGRVFTEADHERASRVVIVDAELARRFFPDGQAIGQRLHLTLGSGQPWAEIVGVAASVKSDGPDQTSRPELYLPFPQYPMDSLFVQVRTSLPLPAAVAGIQRAAHGIDGSLPVTEIASMEQVVSRPADARRFALGLIGSFAGVALVLAVVGIFAVTGYAVAQRRREIGLRMALGAQPGAVVALVIRQGLRPVGTGLLIGLALSVVAALAMRSLLFGIGAIDPQTFLLAPLLLAAAALPACWLPARRAARVDPIAALKAE
jgi:putative ABC transport system permease protein